MSTTSPYKLHDIERIDATGRFVEFVIDIDDAAKERCYRVRGALDMREGLFDIVECTHEWGNDQAEEPVRDRALARRIERFVENDYDITQRLVEARARELDG